MPWDDLEPIDLEPVDLEPGDGDTSFERGPGPNRTRVWLIAGLIGLGLAGWIAVAVSTHGSRPHPAATPATTTLPTPPPIDRSKISGAVLRVGLAPLGVERFAAVIDDRLYTFDPSEPGPTLVRLPEGHVVIAGQNGSTLLASTSEETIVSTHPVSTQTLSVRDTAIAAVAPDQWWRLRSDQTIRRTGAPTEQIPPGLRVVAEVPGGFLALNEQGWVIWSPGHTKQLPALGEFLTAGPRSLVFKDHCGYGGCTLNIYDLVRGTTLSGQLARIPAFASFSPDGTRLALDSTQGDVTILTPSDGRQLVRVQGIVFASPSQSFTWTADGRELLVVQDDRIAVLRASDGQPTASVGNAVGVEQLIALP